MGAFQPRPWFYHCVFLRFHEFPLGGLGWKASLALPLRTSIASLSTRALRVSRCLPPRLLLDGNLQPANQRLPMKHHKTKKSGMAMQMIFGTKGQKV